MNKNYYRKNNTKVVEKPQKEEVVEVVRNPLYQVKVTHPSLKKRNGPSLNATQIGLITDKGTYDIYAQENNWGQLEDSAWICLDFTTKI